MTPKQVVDHYGPTVTAAARALGLSRQTIHRWISINRVPLAWEADTATKSGIRANLMLIPLAAAITKITDVVFASKEMDL